MKNFVEEYFKWLCECLNIDLERDILTHGFSGNLDQYDKRKHIFNIYRLWQEGEISIAMSSAHDLMVELIHQPVKGVTVDTLRERQRFFLRAVDFEQQYQKFIQKVKSEWSKLLTSLPLIDEPISVEVDCAVLDEIRQGIKGPYPGIRIYRYKGDGAYVQGLLIVNRTIIVCNRVQDLLEHLKADKNPKAMKVYVCFISDSCLENSYFMVGLVQGENIWIATDQPVYSNLTAKSAVERRSPLRYREQSLQHNYLPYETMIGKLDSYRKHQHDLTIQTGTISELFTVDVMTGLSEEERILLSLNINVFIERIEEQWQSMERVESFFSLLNKQQLLLPGGEKAVSAVTDESAFFGYDGEKYKECMAMVDDLIIDRTQAHKAGTLPATLPLSLFDGYDSLCTATDFNHAVTHQVYHQAAKKIQDGLNRLGCNSKEDALRMAEDIQKHLGKLVSYLFSGKTVYLHLKGIHQYETFGSKKAVLTKLFFPFKQYDIYPEATIAGDTLHGFKQRDCSVCGKHQTTLNTPSFMVAANHYRVLMWLAGYTDRLQLPDYYLNYKARSFKPYVGNHLLDNVNPLFLNSDVASRNKENRLQFSVRMCGYCRNRLYKKYCKHEQTVVVLNADTLEVDGVYEYSEYIKRLKEEFDSYVMLL